MDLSTNYMGLKLKNPLVASASPLSENIDNIKRMEDAGIAAVVHHSLFEEQITREVYELDHHMTHGTESFAESLTYFPEPSDFILGPEEYLNHIEKAKKAVKIPVIGSLNGHSGGGWVKYAKRIQEAGADALELNIYFVATDPDVSGEKIEQSYLDILRSVKANVTIPVAVKISPFFSALANMAKRLDAAGADGLVLFNRFYQPDIDLETLSVVPNLFLSTSNKMRLPLRWIAILYGEVKASLAATSGIHTSEDVLKMLMAGADATMLCATLLKNGIGHAGEILKGMELWMQENEYESVKQMKGSISQKSCENPEAFERANYMKALQSFGKIL
ncbi:MAG TPA: dihydroorotate dehydrogenase-like protein [Candidatus Omnitrophota bacterium]|nr:dihydroorotate dehydrogenase-like protein [Candidatus Omnitrophota bacterium]HPD84915.1 dihydroorotate dehydrogenase-like protein [Candidatus Omnitrophota bacterium]HRZ03773.1 dihydroorotate dehydrogenase-like protein [Candidatus Omnitrophota bacterium]